MPLKSSEEKGPRDRDNRANITTHGVDLNPNPNLNPNRHRHRNENPNPKANGTGNANANANSDWESDNKRANVLYLYLAYQQAARSTDKLIKTSRLAGVGWVLLAGWMPPPCQNISMPFAGR